jgi:hypothetical protein
LGAAVLDCANEDENLTVRTSTPGRSFFRSLPWVVPVVLLAVAFAVNGLTVGEPPRLSGSTADSEPLLKELIAKDLPLLAMTAPGSSARLTLLRQWAYENTDWSTPGANLDEDRTNRFYEMDAPELFSAFRNDRGGVLCGGTAYAFMRLCRHYGYDALTLDFGAPGVATHVVTLARLSQGGHNVWSIQDPTYDVTFVHRDGTPFDYLDLLRTLRDRQDGEVLVEKGPGRSREFIVALDEAESMLPVLNKDKSFDLFVGPLPGGALKYRRRYSIDEFNEIDGSSTAAFLTREGHPTESIYLFLHPIRISGGWDFDREQHSVPRQARPRFMMKRVRQILGPGARLLQ